MLKLINISKSYKDNNTINHVLENVTINFAKSSINTIFGNSGVGKSTLLNIISLITKSDKGILKLNGDNINYKNDLSILRKKYFGYVFQDHYLLPEFNVLENIIMPCIISNYPKKNAIDLAMIFLEKFNLINIKNKYPCNISIGECQRIAIIRSLMNEPKIIIADEPTANLDENNTNIILEVFKELNREKQYIFIIATHDKQFLKISNNNYIISEKLLVKL